MGEYHDLHLKSDKLLSADVFENLRKMCIETYELDPVNFISAPGLGWQADFKKIEVQLDLLTDMYISLMV